MLFCPQVQFQLNRLALCEMHRAVDALTTLDIVFPDSDLLNKLPHVPHWYACFSNYACFTLL